MATTIALPPGVCLGDSTDGASSIPLLPWEHGDLGVRASLGEDEFRANAASDFRFSELEKFDLVNWDPSVPRRPVNVRESELLSTMLSPSQYPMFWRRGGPRRD